MLRVLPCKQETRGPHQTHRARERERQRHIEQGEKEGDRERERERERPRHREREIYRYIQKDVISDNKRKGETTKTESEEEGQREIY